MAIRTRTTRLLPLLLLIAVGLAADVAPAAGLSSAADTIAFLRGGLAVLEIYRMDANGARQRRLTRNSAEDTFPAWSPDGSRIVFGSDRDGNREIYLMNADGSGQRRLTNSPVLDIAPAWKPTPAEQRSTSSPAGRKGRASRAAGGRTENLRASATRFARSCD